MRILIILLGILVMYAISSIIFWGLGNLIVWVFHLNYTWTIWHGLVCELIFILIKEVFGRK